MAKKRQFIVIDAMEHNGYIDESTAASAKIKPIYLAH
jgi:penicillin-binding protein 1A